MNKKVSLVRPAVELEKEYKSFYREWQDSGETMIPYVIRADPSDFAAMVQNLLDSERGERLPEGRVPDSTYWLVDEDRTVIGVVNIRHKLTEKLLQSGGHIGYGIRPSERRKGYATELLALALDQLRRFGVAKALVVCDEDNISSARTILRNGGIPDTDFVEEDGNVVKRFWIEL
ncbi:GNAT family acetyltransferase [Paenibacillus sp. H1-7]|uniref:GNAT family N-acetyltransferase n=1 Tax=Paenibacillus sp. H1-7 TaxID=2282849 RepID=UPI001EF84EEB|nr:GNAT family N-acetyltransferase [Paenibacillus sp. H1-7]ULL15022.1 GNAT family acetyltransferase [Paenibacillus sp. H1-7]